MHKSFFYAVSTLHITGPSYRVTACYTKAVGEDMVLGKCLVKMPTRPIRPATRHTPNIIIILLINIEERMLSKKHKGKIYKLYSVLRVCTVP